MKLKINYFDNHIVINDDIINVLEIENKKYFYRLVSNLYAISNGEDIADEIILFNDNNEEINLNNKIKVYTNFFEYDFNSKKNLTDINKYIINIIKANEDTEILKLYRKLVNNVDKELNKIDLPLKISLDDSIDSIIKCLKIELLSKEEILDNLLLIIDLEKILKINKILFFINLKQYLTQQELNELYKYSIYNQVKIILIDSQNYGVSHEYESKFIIDTDLTEFILNS